jgi:hypothetical protein
MRSLAGVLVVLVVIFAVTKIPRSGPASALQAVPAGLVKISLHRSTGDVVLEQSGDAWRLTAPVADDADPDRPARLAEGLANLRAGPALTHRAETHALYRVDDAQGKRVTVTGKGGVEAEWIFGKASGDGAQIYARAPGRPEVYLAAGPGEDLLTAPVKSFRDRRLVGLAPSEEPASLRWEAGGKKYEIRHSSDQWRLDGKAMAEGAAQRTVNSLRYLEAQDFVDAPDRKALGLDKPTATLTVETTANRTLVFHRGKPDAKTGTVAVEREGRPAVYLVATPQSDAVFLEKFTNPKK